MPNRAADIMRMMQGTMGAGGAPPPQPGLSSNNLGRDLTTMMGPPPPSAGRFADTMDPEQVRRLMEMMQGLMGGKPAPDTSTLVLGGIGPMNEPARDILPPPGYGGGPTPGPDRSPMYHGQPRRPRRMDMGRFRRCLKTVSTPASKIRSPAT